MGNKTYSILTVAVRADQDVEVTINGPGLGPAGKRFVWATVDRARAFADALNLAYSEGLKAASEFGR